MKRIGFRNLSIVAFWCVLVVAGLAFCYVVDSPKGDLIGLSIVVYSAYAAFIHFRGVTVEGQKLSLPIAPVASIPLLVVGWTSIDVMEISGLKSTGRWMGSESVDIQTPRHFRVLLQSRDSKLAFFDALKTARSDIPIYRSSRG